METAGVDLTPVLHTGELVLIGEELVTVRSVHNDGFAIKEYHVKGTGDTPVFGYRMDNYIGSTTLNAGDTTLNEANGQNLEPLIRPGEVIEVMNDTGGKVHLTVNAVSGNAVSFSPSHTGSSAITPIFTRKKVIVPANASSAQMKSALESLPDIGSVEVTRYGPNQFAGYTWFITFTSNTGTVNLSTGTVSVSYITVSGAGQACDGHFISDSFINGRPRYTLLDSSCRVEFDDVDSEWKLYSDSDLVLSSVSALDVIVPTSGWSNGVGVALSDNTPVTLLAGQGVTADTSMLQTAIDPSFENIIFSAEIDAGESEVQEIVLSSAENERWNCSYQCWRRSL